MASDEAIIEVRADTPKVQTVAKSIVSCPLLPSQPKIKTKIL